MVKFSALVPDGTVNYIKNPSLRYDTTDWNASGATLTRTLTRARFGIASLQVVTAGSSLTEGAYYRVSTLSGISEAVTVSAYVRGTGTVRIRLDNNVVGGGEYASQPVVLSAERWTRISVSGFSTGGNDMRLYVETAEGVARARTFYVDGAQMERKPYPTTYCDGDQEGCRWNGIYHASTSQRPASTRAGGRWVQLAGEEREAQDLYMTVATGLGTAPITNNVQSFAFEHGGYFENKKINMRPILLNFHAKHKVDDQEDPVSLANLHALRQLLIDTVKPDLTGGDEDIWFEYQDGDSPVYFRARYDGGLEGEWDIRNQFVNSFPLRLIAVSPMMREDGQDVTDLDFQDTFTPNFVMGRIDGRWSIMNYGFDNEIVRLVLGRKGEVYAVGTFTVGNNNAAAIDPLKTLYNFAYWDGTQWTTVGDTTTTGGTGGIMDVLIAPNGYIYVTGDFTTIGGVAANYIAYWNGSTWNAMGTGLNNFGRQMAIAPNGDIYVVGNFTTAGGVTNGRISRWDGFQWRRVGQYGGMNGQVWTIAMKPDGTEFFIGGDFTDENGNPSSGTTRAARYNTSTGLFSTMGSGFDSTVRMMRLTSSGDVYAGGSFQNSGSSSIKGVARWIGGTWLALGTGIGLTTSGTNGFLYDLQVFSNGNVLVSGFFVTVGGIQARNIALWNGTTWTNLDSQLDMAGLTQVQTCLINPQTDDIYIGWGVTVAGGNAKLAGITTVTNPGSSEASPIIYVLGPGQLRWIENQTTRRRVYLNLQVLNSEEVFFDFARGLVYSTVRGTLFFGVLAGSDFLSFTLAPGDNQIACFMVDDVNAQMQISLQPTHWSADATGRGEGL